MMISPLGFNWGCDFTYNFVVVVVVVVCLVTLGFMGKVTDVGAIQLLLTFVVWCNISAGCGAKPVLFVATSLLANIEDLPVGAKPVKNPITKHREKWSMAFFHN